MNLIHIYIIEVALNVLFKLIPFSAPMICMERVKTESLQVMRICVAAHYDKIVVTELFNLVSEVLKSLSCICLTAEISLNAVYAEARHYCLIVYACISRIGEEVVYPVRYKILLECLKSVRVRTVCSFPQKRKLHIICIFCMEMSLMYRIRKSG